MENKINRNKIKISLKLKIVGGLVLIMTSMLLFLSTSVFIKTSRILEESTDTILNEKMKVVNEKMDSLIENTERISDSIMQSGIFKENMLPEEIAVMQTTFQSVKETYSEVKKIIFCRADKVFAYPTSELAEQQIPAETEWYNEMINVNSESTWTKPYEDEEGSDWSISYYRKIKENDKVIGFLQFDISLKDIETLLNESKIGESGHIYIANDEGEIVIHDNKKLIKTQIADEELKRFVISKDSGELQYKSNNKNKIAYVNSLDSNVNWKSIGVLDRATVYSANKSILSRTIGFSIICIIVAGITSYYLVNKMANNINQIRNNIAALGEGDLTHKCNFTSKDEIVEIASKYNETTEKLSGIMNTTSSTCSAIIEAFDDMKNMSEESGKAIEETTFSIQEIAAGALDQAKETQEMVNEFNELSSAMNDILNSINEVNNVVSETEETNKKGSITISNLLKVNSETNESNKRVGNAISAINRASKEIGSIINTINDIASQTNLLALNASIEAARAGESGKGFAVVADEIRKLAENSADSANNIRLLIEKVQDEINTAVEEVEISKENSKVQTKAVNDSGEAFDRISKYIEALSEDIIKIDKLNRNMLNMKSGIEASIKKLWDRADENSSTTKQISANTEEQLAVQEELRQRLNEINDFARKLEEEIEYFKI